MACVVKLVSVIQRGQGAQTLNLNTCPVPQPTSYQGIPTPDRWIGYYPIKTHCNLARVPLNELVSLSRVPRFWHMYLVLPLSLLNPVDCSRPRIPPLHSLGVIEMDLPNHTHD